jgi:hypothetical protein
MAQTEKWTRSGPVTPHTYVEGKMIHWKDGVRAIVCILKYRCPREPGIAEGRDKRV